MIFNDRREYKNLHRASLFINLIIFLYILCTNYILLTSDYKDKSDASVLKKYSRFTLYFLVKN